eukprot:14523463-Alexandrium_andersonii.AAC.1
MSGRSGAMAVGTARSRLPPLPGRSPRAQAWGWSANVGGAPGQRSGGARRADGTWQPTQTWGWSAHAGVTPGQATGPKPGP